MLRVLALATGLLLQTLAAHAREPQPGSRVGDVYEIRIESVASRSSNQGSSGDSNSNYLFLERVIAVRDAGVEVEFDLPEDVSAEDRAPAWQYPVRVLRPPHGPLQLLNGPELERRIAAWLTAARVPREACGRWYFTWNAFQIECDPRSVMETLAHMDLRPSDFRDGAPYQDARARAPGVLRREARGPDGAVFAVEMEVDPEKVRRERARADAVVMEISGDSPALRSARQARSAERISGTIAITFETDGAGGVRRTKVTALEIGGPNGLRETETVTETVERRLVPRVGF